MHTWVFLCILYPRVHFVCILHTGKNSTFLPSNLRSVHDLNRAADFFPRHACVLLDLSSVGCHPIFASSSISEFCQLAWSPFTAGTSGLSPRFSATELEARTSAVTQNICGVFPLHTLCRRCSCASVSIPRELCSRLHRRKATQLHPQTPLSDASLREKESVPRLVFHFLFKFRFPR